MHGEREDKDQVPCINSQTRGHARTHTHTRTHAFAALLPVVGVASWAIATFRGSRVVGACAFAVAAAVLALTRVVAFAFANVACTRVKYK